MKTDYITVEISSGIYIAKRMYDNYPDLINYFNTKYGSKVSSEWDSWYMDSENYQKFKDACEMLNYEIREHILEKVEERG